MKQYLMSRETKDGIINNVALLASKAFKAFNSALNVKGTKDQATMDALLKAKTDTFQALIYAITNLNPDMVRELGNQAVYLLLHKPLFPKGGGEMGWNQNQGDEIVDAMKSIQSALENDGGQFRGNKDRIHLMRYQVLKASAVATLCRETGIVPRNGLTAGFVECGLKKLDAKQQDMYKTGNQGWETLSKQYAFIKNALGNVLKQGDRPQQHTQQATVQQAPQPTTGFKAGDMLPPGTEKELRKHVSGKSPRSGERSPRRRQ